MKHTTKKIVDVFPDLRMHFDKRSYNDDAVLSTLEPVKRTFLQLGGFFEQPEEEFNLALLYKHLDNDWLEFALELITEYFRKDTYLIQKPTYSLIREGSHYKSMSQFADYLSEQGLRYDRQKLNLYFERGKVPHPDLVVGGVKYWSDETVQTYAEQEINRMGSIQQEAKK
ncbi:hypothetical protein IHV10_19575 [Fictibacillus sp. 5RED26]|uniref:hypothetical protein n=1 Tax=Fictibacillus sp. 5RED26 TaxID=2745876 RepID=UPI0018CD2240|nr:hypothetical protein [Fictibacillus sp. 5RED26]MBH0158587.1 hypothetical protein [Fictibacillus sp. 5RED26]